MDVDPTGQMYAWGAMVAISAISAAIGIFTIQRRK
ncbi:protein of unknown function [Candidatus Nitrosotalea okcheonensis]|uniref:Uncharacterized protein n=1 Tax=Candidatus Nitrosotalea okcheonensis TaxID=1903276 RepID=A0A2H1FEP0_9ARCH|nr:protein of unknown function [Candidatus Nitrosotalea okcheonensis]